mmetsp:Transcript_8078/g.12358  ORF Transcript_8078/g.12358 Transcript_8078/m.12358 type:complete len:269 (+) Transcript_8078:95-901(+)
MVPKAKNLEFRQRMGSTVNKRCSWGLFFAVFILLSGTLFLSSQGHSSTRQRQLDFEDPSTVAFKTQVGIAKDEEAVAVEGTLLGSNIPFLHCSSSTSSDSTSLVLLHGARFKKEDWQTNGLLEKFCKDFNVVALDLEVKADHVELQNVLKDVEQQLSISLPVSALVTPSASGFSVVDWLDGDMGSFANYIQRWIPVAPPSVLKVTDALSQLKSVPILAIYGSEDSMGQKVSNRLGEMSDAQVVDIPGSHPCYLDSPEEFIHHVRKFLK